MPNLPVDVSSWGSSISLPSRGSFHLSLAVLFAIGHQLVFSLGWWSTQIHAKFLVLRATQDTHRNHNDFEYGAITLYGLTFLKGSSIIVFSTTESYNPGPGPVWAIPRSLAAT